MFEPQEPGLSPLQAFDAVMGFARRRGPAALQLALHAAVPQVVHVDLAQLLRLNFVTGGQRPGVVEADVLFAPFCADLGNGYFRFDANARLQLLQQLDPGSGTAGSDRSLQVADFLLAYLDRERVGERGDVDPLYRSWLEIERWNALAFRDPEATAEQLAAAVQQACAPGQTRARLRVGTLATSLATPLVRHQRLLRYAAGVEALQSQPEDAARLLAGLGDQPLRVGRVDLASAASLLKTVAAPAPAAAPAPGPAAEADGEAAAAPVTRAVAPASGAVRELRDCSYTAYISYAQADDAVWFGWVKHFGKELELSLRSMLRGQNLPPLHLAVANGPVQGDLGGALNERLAASWALIVVVHDNYLHSEWCLRELETFKALFGAAGLRERLYIVALSEPAMRELSAQPRWQRLWEGQEPLWLPFFDREDTARPVDVYSGPGLVAPAFREPFERLRGDLAAKLRRSLAGPPLAPAAPPSSVSRKAEAAPEPLAASLYIELNRREKGLWQPLGEFLRLRWYPLCQRIAPSVVPPPTLHLRTLAIDQIDSLPALDDADGLVLLWGSKTADALMAQINKVEGKLPPGRDAAPGLVAYLVPPQQPSETPVPAWGWQVLRFDVADPTEIQMPEEDLAQVDHFLQKMLERLLQRSRHPSA